MAEIDKGTHVHRRYSEGVASLTTILVIVLLILIIAISITALAFNESSSSSSQSSTITAQEYAEAGARDALQKLDYNTAYSAPTSTPYTIPFVTNGCSAVLPPGCATVSVTNGTGYGSTTTPIVITSVGATGNNSIEVQVNVILDQPNMYGQIATTTWQEISQ
jgi:Tfp pilus assembly protein PilX